MDPVFIDNVEYQTNLSEAEIKVARADIQKSQNLSKSCLSMLAVAVKDKDTQIMHLMSEVLLTHPMILLAASVQANNKVKKNKRCSLEQCLEASKKLNLFHKTEEMSEVYPKKKSSGGVRMIHKPSFLHRVAQTAVKNVMEVFFQRHKWQYTHQGVPRAIRHIKERFNSGHHYFCHLDIKSFFQNFQLEKLMEFLPLPKGVVENVVAAKNIITALSPRHGTSDTSDQNMAYSHGQTQTQKGHENKKGEALLYNYPLPHEDNLLHIASLGIPQGSICSPIIAAYCVSYLAWNQGPGECLSNYADDFIAQAKTAKAVKNCGKRLMDAVGKLPGGSFTLNVKAIGHVKDGVVTLGHHFILKDGVLKISPSPKAINGLTEKMAKFDDRISKLAYPIDKTIKIDQTEIAKNLIDMQAHLVGWAAAFSECDDVSRYTDMFYASLREWCHKLKFAFTDIAAAVTPDMISQIDIYGLS